MKRLVRTASTLIILSALLGCGTTQQSAPDTAILPVDPQVIVGTLPNGLTYYIRENSEPRERAFLRLAVDAGTILEDESRVQQTPRATT